MDRRRDQGHVSGFVAIVRVVFGAQVGVPGLVSQTDGGYEILANLIRATNPPRLAVLLPVLVTKKLVAESALTLSARMLWPIVATDNS